MTTINRAFGIEIECKGFSAGQLQSILRSGGFNNWRAVTDGSVYDGAEVVSPKLVGAEGLAQVEQVVNLLREKGCIVDHQCGLHVHVDAAGLSGYTLANLVKRYAAFESTIDSWMIPERRESKNNYTRSVRELNVTGEQCARVTAEKLTSRYYKLNLCAYLRHGTVEFRQHYGTVCVEEIQAWIQFCVAFVENSTATVTEVVTPGDGSLRANAVEKKYAELIRAFLASRRLSTARVATLLGCSESSVPAVMSHFRTWLKSFGIYCAVDTVRGFGYSLDRFYTDRVQACLNHPGLDRKEIVVNFVEPGLFHGLSPEVREHFENRALAYQLLASFEPEAVAA
jgi:hypothetical protein